MKVVFEKGNVVAFDTLAPCSIALDGYVQGPALDPKGKRFSFDHHAGVIRMVTKATCEMVREAIILGLPTGPEMTAYVNDLDGDTVMSVWLLQNPDKVRDAKVADLTHRIGLTDAHGPVFDAHPMHAVLTPPPAWKPDSPPQSLDMLAGMLAKVTAYVAGEFNPATVRGEELSQGYGWNPQRGWFPVETREGFAGFYGAGAVLGFLHQPAANGTRAYTVAKASDLVAADLGPGSKARPVTSVDQFEDTVLGALGRAEQAANPSQSLAHTWGGGSSIGGSPRNADGSSSRLTPEDVLAVFQRFQP